MTRSKYLHFEVLRTLRNRRFLIFSLVFPLVLFFAVAGPNEHAHLDGMPFPSFSTGLSVRNRFARTIMLSSDGSRPASFAICRMPANICFMPSIGTPAGFHPSARVATRFMAGGVYAAR